MNQHEYSESWEAGYQYSSNLMKRVLNEILKISEVDSIYQYINIIKNIHLREDEVKK
jgi:hypothetical protein